jgi:hypothetical protein
MQRMLSRRGCCHAEDVVVQRRLSCIGFFHAVDFVMQWAVTHGMVSRSGFSCTQAIGRTAQITGLVVNFKINL